MGTEMLEYALRLPDGRVTLADDDRDFTTKRLAQYQEWAPGTVMVERHKPTPWVESSAPHEHICAVVEGHAMCSCLCGTTKPKGDAWPGSTEP